MRNSIPFAGSSQASPARFSLVSELPRPAPVVLLPACSSLTAFLDIQDCVSYTRHHEKQVLINPIHGRFIVQPPARRRLRRTYFCLPG